MGGRASSAISPTRSQALLQYARKLTSKIEGAGDGGSRIQSSNDQLQPLQADGPIRDADWGSDKSNPSIFANRRPNLDIEGKAASMFDRMGTKTFHLRAGLLAIISNRFFPG